MDYVGTELSIRFHLGQRLASKLIKDVLVVLDAKLMNVFHSFSHSGVGHPQPVLSFIELSGNPLPHLLQTLALAVGYP